MNKAILTLTLIISSICAKAQTDKGTVYLGGMLSVNTINSKATDYSYKSILLVYRQQ